jgi:hypothetical protein
MKKPDSVKITCDIGDSCLSCREAESDLCFFDKNGGRTAWTCSSDNVTIDLGNFELWVK